MSVIECEHGNIVDWGSSGEGHFDPVICKPCEADAAEAAALCSVTTFDQVLDATKLAASTECGSQAWFKGLSGLLAVLDDFIRSNPRLVEAGILDSALAAIEALCAGIVDFVRDHVPGACADCIKMSITTGGSYRCLRCSNLDRLERGEAPYVPASGHRAKHYGITEAELQRHLNRAGGHCEICDEVLPTAKDVHIDHNHITGEVRGILCRLCNQGLGFLGDSPQRLLIAADYLNTRGYYGTDE